MFFLISKIFAPFGVPLTYVFLLIGIALIFYQRKPRMGKTCLLLALLLLLVFGTNPLPDFLIQMLETRYPQLSAPPHVDAVVVLSGMVDLQRTTPEYLEFYESVERILAGIKLVKAGYGDVLILAGGSGDLYDQTKQEAVFLRQFALDAGMPAEKILIDSDSRNTHENAVNTRTLMEQHRLSSSLLITTAAHLPRAMGCFQKLGITPIPYPVDFHSNPTPKYHLLDVLPNVGALKSTEFALHEYLGLLSYKLAGYI